MCGVWVEAVSVCGVGGVCVCIKAVRLLYL